MSAAVPPATPDPVAHGLHGGHAALSYHIISGPILDVDFSIFD